jgi:hypothetical protein
MNTLCKRRATGKEFLTDDWPVDDFVRYRKVSIVLPTRFFVMADFASTVMRFVLYGCIDLFRP